MDALPLGWWFRFEEMAGDSILFAGIWFVTWFMLLHLSWTTGCQGFLCFLIISILLRLRWSHWTWLSSLTPSSCTPHSLSLGITLLLTSSNSSQAAEEATFLLVSFSPVAALLLRPCKSRLEGGLCVNLILNLNWLVQRQSVYFPTTFSLLSSFSAFAY